MGSTESRNVSSTGAGSVAIDAAFVPVLVFMAQAAYAATSAGFRNAFLHSGPIVVFASPVIALIVFSVLLPVAHKRTPRRTRFWLCVFFFTIVAVLLTPHLTA